MRFAIHWRKAQTLFFAVGLLLVSVPVWAQYANGMNAGGVLGQAGFFSNSADFTQSALNTPWGVAVDTAGDVWLADSANNRVLEFRPPFSNGMNASLVLGQPDFVSSSTAVSTASLSFPIGVAVDGTGNVWVADYGNNRVLQFQPPFSNGMNASLVLGQPTFSSSSFVVPLSSSMHNPTGVLVDGAGNVWVTDQANNRVLEFQPPLTNGMNAALVLGQALFTNNSAGTTQSTLSSPTGIAADPSGNLWIASSGNNRVLKFTPPFSTGMNASVVLGQPDFVSGASGTSQSAFSNPVGLAADPSGNVWIADYANNRTLEFSPPFSVGMNAALVLGETNFTSNTHSSTQSTLYGPSGVASDPKGNVWILDNLNNRALSFSGSPRLAPGGVTAGALGISSVTWTWNAVAGAASYNFYPSSGGPAIPSAGTSLSQTALSTDTAYGARVSAVNPYGEGPLSLSTSVFTLAAPPSSFSLVQTASTTVAVSWGANTNPGVNYRVDYWRATGSTSSLTTASTQATLTGLSAASTYYVTVSALNGNALAAPCGVVLSTVTTPPPPSTAPAGLSGAALGVSSISWTWSAVAGASGYNFYPSSGGPAIAVAGPPLTQTGLSTNAVYGARVSAWNAFGEGPLSASTAVYTSAAAPAAFALVQTTSVTATVSWGAAGNPSPATSYTASYWAAAGSTSSLTTSATQITATGLSPATTYYFTVAAANGNAVAAPSAVVLSTVTPAAQTVAVGASGGVVSFSPPAGPVTLTIPPGTFATPVNVTLSAPSIFPGGAGPGENLTGTGVGFSIALDLLVQPAVGVRLSVSYRPGDVVGIDQSALLLARYDPGRNNWLPLTSSVDALTRTVTAQTDHFSTFQLMAAARSTSVSSAKAFPNPLRPSQGQSSMTFSFLPAASRIRIYDLKGVLIKDLTADALGTASWDATNRAGAAVASGVYFVYAQGAGQSRTLEVAVQR
ncbi:MAG: fibronectin type III domain-containing protein [Elusimicrobiota bacterium]